LRVKADGETVFEGILKSGSKRTWAAKKILSIRSGNAGGVKISVNDGPAKVMGPTGQVADVTLSR
jgi:hypothetical protein